MLERGDETIEKPMSVRAYRITKLEYDKQPAFNLWNDEELMRFLSSYMDTLDDFGSGYLEFSQKVLEEILEEAEEAKASKETCDTLRQMIEDAKLTGWVKYWCF